VIHWLVPVSSTISWAIFLAGSALAGKKGVAYLKRRLFSQRAPA
jgi:hypothetical protein